MLTATMTQRTMTDVQNDIRGCEDRLASLRASIAHMSPKLLWSGVHLQRVDAVHHQVRLIRRLEDELWGMERSDVA